MLSSDEQKADDLIILLKVSFPLKFKSTKSIIWFLRSLIEEFSINSKSICDLLLNSLAAPNSSTDIYIKKYSLKNLVAHQGFSITHFFHLL